ncbi:putative metallo-hydrolase YybB [Paenibacillus baekrokdamisoli]|uniref:Putative metallo-hydrolase YybB n=1 Tax=Paenibacillus baekrokdamisoli TaxID=1712516 RepID=A0A3G9JFX7_9BACL|nr:MBL fold metallo-hydrolase [Paenibacillus baekrokdamisoli]MBB3072218.1 glyoxylase-like metal-dependent hydrolase (beta-lactamase superfamily II) [Paenibacillus baekrokdamisoli]BBH24801.1 putative metallo-hydrolase YybB [Paenibacillus baekrokdamisoli]
MKIKQISEHIWSLKTWLLIPIHVWVVVEKDGVILVDAGMGLMTKGILSFIDKLQAGPLKAIVLTHGHSDHVGAIKRIQQQHQVPVYAHRIEMPYMEGKLPYPKRKKVEQTVAAGLAIPLKEEASGELELVGGLRPYLTPGHSPGHVVYYHEQDQVMLAGDLFTSKKGQLRKPMAMFTADMKEAIVSSEIVRKLQPKRLEVCHGNSVLLPGEQIDAYIASNSI